MKSSSFLFTLLLFVCIYSNVLAQNTYVPDDNFEQALIDLGYDSGELNDSVPTENISSVTQLNISIKNISDITGIESFSAIEELNLSNNKLSVIDLSYNNKLIELSCFNNQINVLDLHANNLVETIICSGNQLTSIDLSANEALKYLNCSGNQLTGFDLSANVALTYLNCSGNQLTGFDLSSNVALKYLNCSGNQLNKLNLKNGNNSLMTGDDYRITGINTTNNPDLFCIQVDNPEAAIAYTTWFKDKWTDYNANCTSYFVEMTYIPDDNFEQALINLRYDTGVLDDYVPTTSIKDVEELDLSYKQISSLEGIENFESLVKLYCRNNLIYELDLSSNQKLTYLDCRYNSIDLLDVSNNTLLTFLNCIDNNIIDLDLSSNSFLTYLACAKNKLSGLNIRNGNNSNLSVNADRNPDLFCIQVDDVAFAENSNWTKKPYTTYSENCSTYKMEMTYIPDDNFEQALIDLGLDPGPLNDSVPTESLKKITTLNLHNKSIVDLTGIEAFPELTTLSCENNQIVELDLRANVYLTNLTAYNNQLTGLNLQNGNNSNLAINVINNTNLFCIEVDDPDASYKNLSWNKNAYAGYSNDCSNYVMEMTFVPDDNFEQALINMGLDYGKLNDSIPTIAIKSITNLNISNKSINDLTGIEDFTKIEVLNCYLNNIESLDLSENTELTELYCQNNNLQELVLQTNNKLTFLNCQKNPLTSLDLRDNTMLQYLYCSDCDLTKLNIQNSNNLNIRVLDADKNPPLCILVDNIDIAENNTNWYIDQWASYSLDCSGHNLEKVYLPDDNFENALRGMGYDFGTPNDSVYKSIVETITSLPIYGKGIKSLNGIRFFTSLEQLNINFNDISEINLSQNLNLLELNCKDIGFDSLNLNANIKLTELNCGGNQLKSLNVDSCLELQNLTCRNNSLLRIEISNNIRLTRLDCRDNKITELDLSSNVSLESINCNYNQLKSLDLSKNTNITNLVCNGNNLEELILTGNVLLKTLYCGNNQIKTLDLSKTPNLTYLNCEGSVLSSLNLQNGNNEKLRAVDAIDNPHLFCIEVDDPTYSEGHSKWRNDNWAVFSEDCSPENKYTFVPDDNFEQALIDLGYDSGELNDSVLTADINTITDLNLNEKQITSLEGIEDFSLLEKLSCTNNQLPRLNITSNIYLKRLQLGYNNLTTLDISKNIELEYLNITENSITSLDISNNTKLIELFCSHNQLSNIDVSSNSLLKMLAIFDNNLNELNVENNTELTTLTFANNSLTVIDISNNKKLEMLSCYKNNISQLDFSSHPKLRYLECRYNKITDLDLKKCVLLENLYCDGNFLTNLDLSTNTLLKDLLCGWGPLQNLTIGNNDNISRILCSYCNIAELDLSGCSDLVHLESNNNKVLQKLNIKNGNNHTETTNEWWGCKMSAYENPNLSCIEVDNVSDANAGIGNYANWIKDETANYSEGCGSDNKYTFVPDDNFEQALIDLGYDSGVPNDSVLTADIDTITFLDIRSKGIYDLTGIKAFSSLKTLNCSGNELTSLKLNANTKLTELSCSNNQLTSLDLSDNKSLTYTLSCNHNLLTYLNVNNTQIHGLSCHYNKLKSLDLSNVPYLENLSCTGNLLDSIDLSNTKALSILACNNNNINKLDLSNNTELTSISCSFNSLSNLILDNNTQLKRIHCNNNNLKSLITINLKQLEYLQCEYNSITSLDISSNSRLQYLKCFNNSLTNLNIKNGNNHNFSFFSATNNSDLNCIQVDDPSMSLNYKNWEKDEWASYSLNCTPNISGIPISEYNALVDFYTNLDGDNWLRNDNWLDTTNYSVNEWFGITVEDGHVSEINFDAYHNYNLNGSIPNSIRDLSKLKKLKILTDDVSGSLPDGLFELENLEELYIAECKISGNIPSEIGNLSNLKVLGLEANQIEGGIPAAISYLSNLEFLSLYENQLGGEIPVSLGQLNNLYYLGLANNKLEGNIPVSLGNLTNLKWLLLDNNQLSGAIPKELANLTNILKFTFANNLIGSLETSNKSAFLKSGTNENNRQIPDELANLIELDTFRVSNNNLQFNDLEAIFSWKNFSSFNDFIYAPQDYIGSAKTIEVALEKDIILTIDNYYPGNSDLYQWYKNGVPVENGKNSSLMLEKVKTEDTGKYYCIVTNPVANALELSSKEITLRVLSFPATSGVPVTEYNALVNFYNLFEGSTWINNLNWLDTVKVSVNDWAGVTAENGNVVALDLSNLGIEGEIFDIFSAFDSLTWLNLSNNHLSGQFPTFNGSKSAPVESVEENEYNLTYLNIANNNFIFSDLEPVAEELMAIDIFIYSPQNTIGSPVDTSIYKEESITFELENFTSGINDFYQWLLNENEINGTAEASFTVENAMLQDGGIYNCIVRNTLFPDLILKSENKKLGVKTLVGINELDINNIEIFPNPAENKVFINANDKRINLKVFNFAGSLVIKKDNIQSEWIDISEYSKGIYIFRIEHDQLGVITRKVVFK